MSSKDRVRNYLGDRKEAVGTKLLAEKKSVGKDAEKGTDELADTLLSEKNPQQRMLIKVLTNWQICYCLRRNPRQRMLRKVLMNLQILY